MFCEKFTRHLAGLFGFALQGRVGICKMTKLVLVIVKPLVCAKLFINSAEGIWEDLGYCLSNLSNSFIASSYFC